jgi:hypothetical protein
MPQPRQYPDAAAKQRAYRDRQAQARTTERQTKGLPAAPAIATMPSRARWQALLQHAQHALQTIQDELQAYADARSDAWHDGERAAAVADQLDHLAGILDDLDTLPPF